MDNLTHSLVGALLGQMGLKRKTGLAMPTLIIAANIPDIDAVAVLLGGHQHLAIRRGITHGPIAMVVLPLILWGAMLWFDAWQAKRGKRPEKRLSVHKGWLLALAFIGCLSHPLFDWFNSYGIRLLEPFSSQWFYGDTLFIIDVWIWAALVMGVWLSVRCERQGKGAWQRPAWVSLAAVSAYIFANGFITGKAEAQARYQLGEPVIANSKIPKAATDSEPRHHNPELLVVANPVPLAFWRREMLWRDGTNKGEAEFSLFGPTPEYSPKPLCFDPPCPRLPKPQTGFQLPGVKNALAEASADPDVAAFLFWSRMPVIRKGKTELILGDQRFGNPMVSDRFTVSVPLNGKSE
jgi:inner membrane protein